MSVNRRNFIKSATTFCGGLALTSISSKLVGCSTAQNIVDNDKAFGLQLYTLRADLPKDPKGVLRQVASYGYKQIESYEGPQGMFWGMTNTEFKKYMDELGMKIVSSHCNIDQDFERKAAEAAAIDMKYLIAPWLGPQKTIDDYKRAAEKYNNRGEICKKAGIRFAYHNHDYSFTPVDGQFPQDIMMQNTDKDLVDYEMDMYWVVAAGQDPLAWMKKYPNRFRLGHVKDRKKGEPLTNKNASVVVGTGSIDYAHLLEQARKEGMRYFIVEQEAYEGTTPLAAVKDNAEQMKKINF